MEDWKIWAILATAWAGLIWYVKRHITRVDNLENRIGKLERDHVGIEKLDSVKTTLRSEYQQQSLLLREELQYIRQRVDKIFEKISRQ